MYCNYYASCMCLTPNMVFFIGTQIFGVIAFVACNAFFGVVDLTGKPEFLLKYKIQEEKIVPVSSQALCILTPSC